MLGLVRYMEMMNRQQQKNNPPVEDPLKQGELVDNLGGDQLDQSQQVQKVVGDQEEKVQVDQPVIDNAPQQQDTGPKWKNKVNSGFGDDVDKIIDKSPKLKRNMKRLAKKGWTIDQGEGGGCYANRGEKKIYIDKKQSNEDIVQSIAHEVGHARYKPMKGKSMSKAKDKNDFVKANVAKDMDDEGAATIMNLKVRDEILKNSNNQTDINVAGANAQSYKDLWANHKKKGIFGSEKKLRGKVAEHFGQGERTSTTNEKYDDYYGGHYAKVWDKHNPVN